MHFRPLWIRYSQKCARAKIFGCSVEFDVINKNTLRACTLYIVHVDIFGKIKADV